MNTVQFVARLAFLFTMLFPCLVVAQNAPSTPSRAPVPAELLSAKKIFVSNAGADSGLFPHPFSGDPSRGYNQLFAALHSLGQYELVSSPSQADLVLELRLVAPTGPKEASKIQGSADPMPMFRLVVYDRPSHYVLWTFTDSIEMAMKQQTHDRNFDESISALVAEFQALTHAPRPTGQ
jgi:hypothetical protein